MGAIRGSDIVVPGGDGSAEFERPGAAGVKPAPGRGAFRAGNVAGQDDPVLLDPCRIGMGNRGKQGPGVRMARGGEEGFLVNSSATRSLSMAIWTA